MIERPPRDRLLVAATAIGFVLWIACVGPVRTWASEANVRSLWVFGVAPSFFAGFTLACWQAVAVRSGPFASAALGFGLIVLAEAAHIVMPRSTADVWDIAAGAAGVALAAPFIAWRLRGGHRGTLD
ncbi:MAG: hypothetical protein AAGI91_16030 [Bacteroidota bacterium]